MIVIKLETLRAAEKTRPPGYMADVLAHAANVTAHYIEIPVAQYDALCKKYRADYTSIYDQIATRMANTAPLRVYGGKNAPGTVLLRFLQHFGFHLSADCPCRKKIELINARGLDWARANKEQILNWLCEEAEKWGENIERQFAIDLLSRTFEFAKRHEKAQTQFLPAPPHA